MRQMERIQIVHLLFVVLIASVERTFVSSCPTECPCRGTAAKCKTGLTSYPTGLGATVKHLSVSGSVEKPNTIQTLGKALFQSTPNVELLVIAFSKVRTIENGAFSGLTKLRDLSLADNELTTLTGEMFSGLTSLRTLDLSGNKNCRFDKTVFTHLRNLEELNLGDMAIDDLELDIFNLLSKLKGLKLYSNNFVKLEADAFLPLANLESLDLTGNKLLGLETDFKPLFSKLKTAHLGNNPWQCNCRMPWLRELPSSFTSSRTDTSEVICNGPLRLKYTSLMNVPDDELICIPPKVIRCESTTYSLDVNKRLVISCEFEGDPEPYVKWIQPGGKKFDKVGSTQGAYTLHYNGTLDIDSVTAQDDGQWTVVAYNSTASDEMNIDVKVIITTTSTSTTTTTTTTTTPPTTKSTAAPKQTQKITAAPKPTSKLSTVLSPQGPKSTSVLPESSKAPVSGESDKDVKEDGVNIGLLIAAAAGGGTLVGLCFITVMCCKKKQGNPSHEKNRVRSLSIWSLERP